MSELFAGRYALGRLLGAGGAGRVFAARDERLHRPVAIKLVPTARAAPVVRQRFVREARSAAAFTHPNAVALFDAGEFDDYLYLVMELVEGESLAERLARGRIAPAEAQRITSGVLAALGAAHVVGIVHRDVKPGNVLLAANGDVKLTDFGIAKRLDEAAGDVTVIGDIVGTPKYLAPELVGGAPASVASDLYAAGVVLFEMLAGRPPFDADTPLATALAHRDHPVPELAAVGPGVPERLADAARRAMAKSPGARFASAEEMLAAIRGTEHSVPDTAVLAAPIPSASSPPTRIVRPGYPTRRRSPWWVVAAATLAAGGVALVLVVGDGDDDPASTASSIPGTARFPAPAATSPPPGTPSPATLSPATPSSTVTTAILATAAAPAAVTPDTSTVEGIIALLSADPDAYGSRTGDLIVDLDQIRGNGRNAQRRAGEALQHAEEWVGQGALDRSVVDMLRPVLEPLAALDGPSEQADASDEDDRNDD